MPDTPNPSQSEQERQNEYMRGGKGRKDEVGGSGIYPASSTNAPGDAQLRSEGELVQHRGVRDKLPPEESPEGAEQSLEQTDQRSKPE